MSKNGIVIGYQGHVPNVIFQHGQTTLAACMTRRGRPTFGSSRRLRSRTSIIRACRAILATHRGYPRFVRREQAYTGAGKAIHETEHQRLAGSE